MLPTSERALSPPRPASPGSAFGLGRGVRYQVVGARRIGGRWHVYGEVLQEGEG